MATSASRIAFRSLCMTACIVAVAACRQPHPGLQAARDAIATSLPAPYFEDLVTESATIEGNRLVLRVRSPAGDAGKMRAHARFEELRQSEQQQMRDLCALEAIRPLVGSDAILVRRFVDRSDAVFFETTLPARECAGAAPLEPK